jgi:hypothetical protein
MRLNHNIWRQPNVGGVTFFVLFLLVAALICFTFSVHGFLEQKVFIKNMEQKLSDANHQLNTLQLFKDLKKSESASFEIFKRCNRDEVLTVESLNKALYKIQKQTDVDFLFINAPNFVTQNGHTNGFVSLQLKVLRDYSFFSFLKKLEMEMPGIVKIVRFELRRDKEVNQQIVQKIKNGEKTSLFEGSIDFEIAHEAFF